MDKSRFYKYLHLGQRFVRETLDLMKAINAPSNLRQYDVEVYGNAIIDYWNRHYEGTHVFKLFVFGSYGNFKPLYAYGPDTYTMPIILYFDNKHFDGVRRASDIFGQSYCLACEKVYDRHERHKMDCKQRCVNCSRIGPNFPCKPADNYSKKCSDCNKQFYNENCFSHHKKSNFCKRSIKCEDCGKIYRVDPWKWRSSHVCDEPFCNVCHVVHNPMRGCYIEPLEPKEQKPYRLIAFDVETKQHRVVDPAKNKRRHEVNFIAASVACGDCIKSGAWKTSLNGTGCEICGKHRTVAFAEHDFNDTEVDKKFITSDPLRKFVKWLLYELPLNHESIIYSHYGGRLVIRGGNCSGKNR